jgi:hypothetical protein
VWKAAGIDLLVRTANGTSVAGLLPVVPMTLISVFLMWSVSLMTGRPSQAAINRYFPAKQESVRVQGG